MKLSWAGRLFAMAFGMKAGSFGLRWLADQIPGSQDLEVTCPHCSVTALVPGAGNYKCWQCAGNIMVSE